MNIRTAVSLTIADQSGVGEARRMAAALAAETDLNGVERGSLAIIVTEAASNLVRHAGEGEIIRSDEGASTPTGV